MRQEDGLDQYAVKFECCIVTDLPEPVLESLREGPRELPSATWEPPAADQDAADECRKVRARALSQIFAPVCGGNPQARGEQAQEQRNHHIPKNADLLVIRGRADEEQPGVKEGVRPHVSSRCLRRRNLSTHLSRSENLQRNRHLRRASNS